MVRVVKAQVVNNRMTKSVLCVTYSFVRHMSGKMVARRKKLIAHDERNACRIGDIVLLRQVPKMSKRKSHEVMDVVRKAPSVQDLEPTYKPSRKPSFPYMPTPVAEPAAAQPVGESAL